MDRWPSSVLGTRHFSCSALLAEIYADVRVHVGFFTRGLTPEQRDAALSIFAFYVGATVSTSKSSRW